MWKTKKGYKKTIKRCKKYEQAKRQKNERGVRKTTIKKATNTQKRTAQRGTKNHEKKSKKKGGGAKR